MTKRQRITLGGYVYHALNRANGRLRIFRKAGDFPAFKRALAEGLDAEDAERWRRHERTGRPLRSDAFLDCIEQRLSRSIRPAKRGPKPKPKEK